MSLKIKTVAVAVAALFTVEGAMAGERCASPRDYTSLKLAALQQELMVAALTCHETQSYNRFVLGYRPQLQRSDKAMLAFFKKRDGARAGDAHYNAYKTKLANDAMLQENADSDGFCDAARSAFQAAFEHRGSLNNWVASQRVSLEIPYEDCSNEQAAVEPRGHVGHASLARQSRNWDDEAPTWRKDANAAQ
jgi:hypothetical protein